MLCSKVIIDQFEHGLRLTGGLRAFQLCSHQSSIETYRFYR